MPELRVKPIIAYHSGGLRHLVGGYTELLGGRHTQAYPSVGAVSVRGKGPNHLWKGLAAFLIPWYSNSDGRALLQLAG